MPVKDSVTGGQRDTEVICHDLNRTENSPGAGQFHAKGPKAVCLTDDVKVTVVVL
jgi:hypothetical protein